MKQYEEYLRFFLAQEKRESFRIAEGSGRVILSAPHSVSQRRDGRPKPAEYQTGILVNMLHDETDCHAVFKTSDLGDDANHDSDCPYKEAVCSFVRAHDVKYLIDLHQLSPEREEDLAIGTGYGKNILSFPAFPDVVARAFGDAGIGNIDGKTPFEASYPYTVSSYVSRLCGIACVQIEINSRLVCRDFGGCRFDSVFAALKQIVNELNGR